MAVENRLLRIISGRQSFDQLVNLFSGVVKMWGEAQTAQSRRGDDTMVVQEMIEFMSRIFFVAAANDRRFFTVSSRTGHLIAAIQQPLAKVIAEIEQVAFNFFNTYLQEQFDHRSQPDHPCGVQRARLEPFRAWPVRL